MLIRRSTLPAVLVSLAVVLATVLVGAPRAEASSTLLCKGFTNCARAGYSNFGYASNYRQMWWRMYAGHNCTNYVAYRMVTGGMSATRPWSGSGDARNWGVVFANKTNQTPTVGSIAWWSSNHVAYVEQVIDANTIVISEDHWGGDFDWRRIVRAGGGWPTGFIHLNDQAIKVLSYPRISGTAEVDQPLTVSTGWWSEPGVTHTYQWLANGVTIPGATTTTFTPSSAYLAKKLSVRVTAAKTGFRSGTSTSPVSAAVAPGTLTTAQPPVVTGTPKVGGLLTLTGGSFTPATSSTSISWLADGVPVAGATQPTLRLGAAQLGRRITAVVTGRRAAYTDATVVSAATAPVGPEHLTITGEPRLASMQPRVGRAVVVTPGAVGPAGVVTTYEWLRNGHVVEGPSGASYVPTVEDLGTRLSARVTYAKPGYTSIVRTLGPTRVVQVLPRVRVVSRDHREVTVRVLADGVRAVGGTVTLRDARGNHRTRELVRGRTTFAAAWLRKGWRALTVEFSGSFRVEGRTVERTIKVL